MRRAMFAALCGLVVMTVMPVSAQTSQRAAPATPADKPICRYYGVTGSILPGKRVCHTKPEWQDIDAQNQANARLYNDPIKNGSGHSSDDPSNPS